MSRTFTAPLQINPVPSAEGRTITDVVRDVNTAIAQINQALLILATPMVFNKSTPNAGAVTPVAGLSTGTLKLSSTLQLSGTYAAGVVASTGVIPSVLDNTGTAYKVLVHT